MTTAPKCATRVAEFATSLGVSALYLAAAVRDNGSGIVIGSGIVPAKAEQACANLAAAGLDSLAEIRVADVLETFTDLSGPVDFLLVDGWPNRSIRPCLLLSLGGGLTRSDSHTGAVAFVQLGGPR
jgi:predicted O-methyltransferase YrrM